MTDETLVGTDESGRFIVAGPPCRCGEQLAAGLKEFLDLAERLREPRLYTFEEVSELTGMTVRTLEDRARRGDFEHVSFRDGRRMTREQVDALIAKYTVRSTDDLMIQQELDRRRARGRR